MSFVAYRNALRDYIAAQSYGETFTVENRNVIVVESERSTNLRCFVAPVDRQLIGESRADSEVQTRLVIAFIQQLTQTNLTDRLAREDALITLIEEVEASIALEKIGGKTYQRDPGVPRPVFDLEVMSESQTFSSTSFFIVKDAL